AAAITATGTRTSSAANAGNRSIWSSAQRYSIATFRPSTKPSLLRPWRNAAAMGAYPLDVWPLRNPATGIVGCCLRAARATCGSKTVAPAPPRSVMNSRRLMSNIGPPHRVGATKNHRGRRPLSLPPAGLQVLGLDLNCSGSRRGAASPAPRNNSTHLSLLNCTKLNFEQRHLARERQRRGGGTRLLEGGLVRPNEQARGLAAPADQ